MQRPLFNNHHNHKIENSSAKNSPCLRGIFYLLHLTNQIPTLPKGKRNLPASHSSFGGAGGGRSDTLMSKTSTEQPLSDGGAPLPDALAQVTFAPPLESTCFRSNQRFAPTERVHLRNSS